MTFERSLPACLSGYREKPGGKKLFNHSLSRQLLMACSSDRIGHSWLQSFDAAHNHDIVLLSMPFVFRGTLDVLSLVPGAHLPVKASRFHPQFPAFRLIRPGARLGTASSPAFRLSGTVSLLHRFPGPSGHPIPRPFGQPVPALGTERHSP